MSRRTGHHGVVVCVLAALVAVAVAAPRLDTRADYVDEVRADRPIAYWRLGEPDGVVAASLGSAVPLDGTYVGGVLLEEDGLLFEDDDSSVAFDGFSAEVQIPDHPSINTGGPYPARTIELWFLADFVDVVPGMLYEQGGATRGLNLFVQEVDGEAYLYMSAWNRAEQAWGPIAVRAPIEAGEVYHAVLVLDASDDAEFGDFDGRLTGYLDGVEFASETGADQLYSHGDDGAIGGIHVNTLFPDVTNPGDGGSFTGWIDEVAAYAVPLDDPDDDGDRSDSRVLAHFAAGSNPRCPGELETSVDAGVVTLTWTNGDETSVRVLRNGAVLAASAPVAPPRFVDDAAEPGVLDYELIFDVPGEPCRSLRSRVDGCIAGLTVSRPRGSVELAWANRFPYTSIDVQRGDEVIATIDGDLESYADIDPPVGEWLYSVAPENGDCEPATIVVRVPEPGYPALIVGDGAVGYWRLGEDEGAVTAGNLGGAGAAADGTYAGFVTLGDASLLPAEPDDPSAAFDGFGAKVLIPDHPLINLVPASVAFSVELWFAADVIDVEPRVLWEQGGTTRGLNLIVQQIDGLDTLVMSAWNLGQEIWGPISVPAEIEAGETYHAVLVLSASENDVFGDFDGRVTAYLDGEEVETRFGADRLYSHTDDIAIGGLGQGTLAPDGTALNTGGDFIGRIDEVAVYGVALDDLDGEGFDSDRIDEHYRAGTRGGGGERPTFHRADSDGDGNVTLSDAVHTLNYLFAQGPDTTCKETQDFDNDGAVLLTDAVASLRYLFAQGPPPAAPGPTSDPCGPDPDAAGSRGDLGCASYPRCD